MNTVNGPRPEDFSAARQRHQKAVELQIPGVIEVLNGMRDVIERIACAVRVQESQLEMTEEGPVQVQRAFARIAKADLPDGLKQGTIVRINDRGFKVESDPADNCHDESWAVEFTRAPGGDL